jgi:signal transduction histidine kinase
VLIPVEDEGAGVPDELKEVIFEPFRQGPQRSQHSPGVGIGLSLVARFAELHGGQAWVEDRPGGSAAFRVFLPAGEDGSGDLDRAADDVRLTRPRPVSSSASP